MQSEKIIVLAEANSQNRAAVRGMLSKVDPGFVFQEFSTLGDAAKWCREQTPHCALLSAFGKTEDLADLLRECSDAFPVLALAASREEGMGALKAGANAYVLADELSTEALRLAIEHAYCVKESDARLARQREEMLKIRESAQAAVQAKDRFLATLSHELRTPLTPVLSVVSSSLSDRNITPDLRETFRTIQRNIELEARLIDDLLDLTQITSGHLLVERKPVDIHETILGALEICRYRFEDKQVAIESKLDADVPLILGESARLHQVLWNVLNNAVKFTSPEGRVLVSTRNCSGQVVISVEDTGIGIEPDRIEEVFVALHLPVHQRTSGGLGLGLAIAKAIVEAHGGTISARSNGKGQGATFEMRFPLAENAELEAETEVAEDSASFRGKTILIVEDHDDTRRVLSRALRRRGFGVAVAENVETACRQYELSPTDVVICDIGLPDGTGWEAVERLKKIAPVRAIAVSGYGMDQDLAKSQASGFKAHVTKPVNFHKLEQVIQEVLLDV